MTFLASKQTIAQRLVEQICSFGPYVQDDAVAQRALDSLTKLSRRTLTDLAELADVDTESDLETIVSDPDWVSWVQFDQTQEVTEWPDEAVANADHPRVIAWMNHVRTEIPKEIQRQNDESPIEYIITDPEWEDWVLIENGTTLKHDPRVLEHAKHSRVAAWMKQVEHKVKQRHASFTPR